MRQLLYFELKKIINRRANQVAMLLGLLLMVVSGIMTIGIRISYLALEAFIFSTVLSVLGFLFLDPLCRFLGSDEALLYYCREYMIPGLIAIPFAVFGIMFQLRKEFPIKKLGLILVGADTFPKLFDSIKMQYQLTLSYFHLQDAGMVLVRGAEKKGDVKNGSGLREAYELGLSVK